MCSTVPFTPGMPMSTKAISSAPPSPGSAASRSAHARVLIAEDNPVNQRVAVIILSKLGFDSDVAGDGVETLQKLENQHFDVVLMDCQMPGMDGYEATQAIRALPSEKSQVPIIAVTANALPGQREKCLAFGMNDYISKPIDKELLASTIRKYLPASAPQNGEKQP